MNLPQLLHALAEALDELPTTAAGLTGTRRTGTIARVGHSPGIHVHAVDVALTASIVLTGWTGIVLTDDEDIHLPPGHNPSDTATLARWMADHHDAFGGHEAARDMQGELLDLLAIVRRCIDPGTGRGPVRPEKAAQRAGHDGLGSWVPLALAEGAGRLVATMHGLRPDDVPSESTIRRRIRDGRAMGKDVDGVMHVQLWTVIDMTRDTPDIAVTA